MEAADTHICCNPLLPEGVPPTRVVRPRDMDELQTLVREANARGAALVPVSSSPPHVRGGTRCEEEHALVDLSHWKRCDLIDRRNRVCRIEPGVTYDELLDALAPHGLTVPMPLAPRTGKSVLAAVLDREPSTWPNKQWDAADPVASTEFLFGTGDRFRTGAAGGPGSLEQQRASGGAQKSPMGPSQTDFHRVVQGSQGSMGIATWITLRAEVRPSLSSPRIVQADRLERLLPFVYAVQRPWLGEHAFLLDRTAAAMLLSRREPASIPSLRDSLPAFLCLQNVAGFDRLPEERVAYQLEDIREMAERHGLALAESAGPVSARDLLSAALRTCGPGDWRHAVRGHCCSLFFLTTLDRAPGFVERLRRIAENHLRAEPGPGFYLQPVVQNHACHLECMLPFDPGSSDETRRARAFETEAVAACVEEGAFFSRPYGAAVKPAFSANPLAFDVLGKVKHVFDPNRVLSPGRFGL